MSPKPAPTSPPSGSPPGSRSACPSPCIGVCSTSVGDSVCRGCKRFLQEIADWSGYADEQKWAVEKRLQRLLLQAIGTRFEVRDSERMSAWLEEHNIRYAAHREPLCWVVDLLNGWFGGAIDWEECGLKVREDSRESTPAQLRQAIDQSFYQLSLSYWQRYADQTRSI